MSESERRQRTEGGRERVGELNSNHGVVMSWSGGREGGVLRLTWIGIREELEDLEQHQNNHMRRGQQHGHAISDRGCQRNGMGCDNIVWIG